MKPILSIDRADIFFDGMFSEPRLKHPEGIALDGDGNVWCGGEGGEIYRIRRDGSEIELVASTEGFTLGLAFDGSGNLYTCDLKHAAVFRLDTDGRLERFADGDGGRRLRVPNFPVIDERRNCLYVSDSYDMRERGPGVWRFDLDTGKGGLWYDRPMVFANGMALSHEGDLLYVAETFARRVSRIPILRNGSAGEAEVFVRGIERLPDGLAFDAEGNLYVSCYEPSRIYKVSPDGRIELLIDDPEAHTLCHPTNCAFRGGELFASNLGRWHITRIVVDARERQR
ncbi:MAG: SMP-30/gluconolactonase/LRE family protein [Rubrobacteraceae bacterium]